MRRLSPLFTATLFAATLPVWSQTPDWAKVNVESLKHFRALIGFDTTHPPGLEKSGNETLVVEYARKVLEAEGIQVTLAGKDPTRLNLIARIQGNGSKRPILLMGHSDTVQVEPAKWKFPPFSATREGGYIYGRGTLDDKDNVTAGLMTMLLLKRNKVPLDRDVIFVIEGGEEGSPGVGIGYLASDHWNEIEAEYCFAEGARVVRTGGMVRFAEVETAEKAPQGAKLVAHGPAGHASRPLRTNAVVHLSGAVAKVAAWDPPMRLNDTTRYYFERLATVSSPEAAARYNGLLDPGKSPAIRDYLAEHEPENYSRLHTSISPTVIKGGLQVNVIPSEAEVALDIRALPDEDMAAFFELMRKEINDPAVEIVSNRQFSRPIPPASRIDTDAYYAVEAANQKVYGVITLPTMNTAATDMSQLRAKGVQCYGIGTIVDSEDGPKGFGAHSDQERVLEEGIYKFVQFHWEVTNALAGSRR